MQKEIFKTIGVILVAGILLAPTIGYVQGKDPTDRVGARESLTTAQVKKKIADFIQKLSKLSSQIQALDQEIADLRAQISTQSGDLSTPIDVEGDGIFKRPVIRTFPTIKPPRPSVIDIAIDPKNQSRIDKLRAKLEAEARAEALRINRNQSDERLDLDHEDSQTESEPQVSVPKSPTIIIYSGPNCKFCTILKNNLDQRYPNFWQDHITYYPTGLKDADGNSYYPKFVKTIPYIIINGVRASSPGLMQELDKLKNK